MKLSDLAAILATETNGQTVMIPREGRTMIHLKNSLRLALRWRGYNVAIHKHGDEAVRVWVTGRRG